MSKRHIGEQYGNERLSYSPEQQIHAVSQTNSRQVRLLGAAEMPLGVCQASMRQIDGKLASAVCEQHTGRGVNLASFEPGVVINLG